MTKSLYQILGASVSDDLDTIKRRYRDRARACHPDRNPGNPAAAEEFKAITEAFEILSDPDLRAAYDKTGEIPNRASATNSAALTVLSNLLHGVMLGDIQNGRPTSHRELLKDIRQQLEAQIQKREENVKKLEASAKVIEDIASRFTTDDGQENVLAAIARAPLREIHGTIEIERRELAEHKEAWAILKRHRFNRVNAGVVWRDSGIYHFGR